MNIIKSIIWEKWKDPYGLEEEDIINNIPQEEDHETYNQNDEDEDEYDEDNPGIKNNKHPMSMMVTPMGLIPYTENTAACRIFNFWTGHTNFNITQKTSNFIEEIDGIETLDIYTRYRFRIGVGKNFKDSTVMREINTRVCKS